MIAPTEAQIFEDKVQRLKDDIWSRCQGQTISLIDIRTAMLQSWFGKVKGPHFTQALKELQETDQRIVQRSGGRTQDYTRFTFKNGESG